MKKNKDKWVEKLEKVYSKYRAKPLEIPMEIKDQVREEYAEWIIIGKEAGMCMIEHEHNLKLSDFFNNNKGNDRG